MSGESKARELRSALEELDAELYLLDPEEAGSKIAKVLLELGARRIALASDPLLNEIGLERSLRDSGLELLIPPGPVTDPVAAAAWRSEIAEADAGVTSAVAVAVETGSALLCARVPDQRAVSLLPEIHMIIIREEQLVQDIAELMESWKSTDDADASAVIVTGASRTADIEKELVLGVHGPSRLIMVVLRRMKPGTKVPGHPSP